MRSLYLRSILRTAIALGVVSASVSGAQAGAWRGPMNPHAGICFIHDLDWEQLQINNRAAAQEREDVKLFRQQVSIVFESLQTNAVFWKSRATNALVPIVRTVHSAKASIAASGLQLVDWLRIPDVLPVAVLAESPALDSAGASDAIDYSVASSCTHVDCEFANDAAYDWNCNEWDVSTRFPSSGVFPQRDRANIYVYTFSNNPISTVNRWQTGIDPVCPEINTCNSNYKPDAQTRVSCPIEQSMLEDAIAIVHPALETKSLPPTLEAEQPMVMVSSVDESKWPIDYFAQVMDYDSAWNLRPWLDKGPLRRHWSQEDVNPVSGQSSLTMLQTVERQPEKTTPISSYSRQDLAYANRFCRLKRSNRPSHHLLSLLNRAIFS
jgi:hypothetical protein